LFRSVVATVLRVAPARTAPDVTSLGGEELLDTVLLDTQVEEDLRADSTPLGEHSEQEVFRAHVLVTEPLCLLHAQFDCPRDALVVPVSEERI
jgi:hypothetical protein